jgi:hypothetical protein
MLTRIMKEITPVPKEQLKSLTISSSRRSRASSILSEAESETSVSLTPSTDPGSKRSFLSKLPIRSRRAGTASSQSEAQMEPMPALDKRKALLQKYSAMFAPLIIRSGLDDKVRGKEAKMLNARKTKVLEAFLEMSQL